MDPNRARVPHLRGEEQAYYAAARDRKLVIQQCSACDRLIYPFRVLCPSCGQPQPRLTEVSGRGTVYSFTVVQRAVYAEMPAPYVVALVDLDEGVRVMANVVDCLPADVQVGMRVTVTFEQVTPDFVVPQFRPL